ncbi:unnamed protein product [Symbiodinium microadriaticum]|nr:unnamed protein product [Symbiodinium microadriaticum]
MSTRTGTISEACLRRSWRRRSTSRNPALITPSFVQCQCPMTSPEMSAEFTLQSRTRCASVIPMWARRSAVTTWGWPCWTPSSTPKPREAPSSWSELPVLRLPREISGGK